jgi:signal transduction histidine kinase
MRSSTEQNTFDALYPFSFVADARGAITKIGRSLGKVYPTLRPGTHFLEDFLLEEPRFQGAEISPAQLVGEIVVLTSASDSPAKLRGQVVSYSTDPDSFLFALEIAITSLSDISRLRLTLDDFKVGDPIFDMLLYMQGQQLDQKKLRSAKSALESKNRRFAVLLEMALEIEKSGSEREVYQKAITLICRSLHWEFGHVLVPCEDDPNVLVSGDIWEVLEPLKFDEFCRATQAMRVSFGEGLPGRVKAREHVVWATDAKKSPFFVRRLAAKTFEHLTGVGVPVTVDRQVVAALEFFTTRHVDNDDKASRFFELLSLQLSSVIGRIRAEIQAREHAASLAQASKLVALGEISAGIAHEINNPLHTLTLTTTLLKRLSSSDRLSKEMLEDQLNRFEMCIGRMAMIVSELKAFSRDSSADPFQATSLKHLIGETLDLCHARLSGEEVSVFADDIPEDWTAECRASQISQVILNLLNNAFDAIADQPERWIKVEATDKDTHFEIGITDSGAGIDPATAAKIMLPFFTTKPPGKGTGLGLSISRNIMSDHGGSLSLDQSSQHTRFVVALPKNHLQPSPSTCDEHAPL